LPPLKVLLDECVDRRLAAHVVGYQVSTVVEEGWAGLKNGELLKVVEAAFDVFVTVDRNLAFQQNVSGLGIAVIVLCGVSNRLGDLVSLTPKLLESLGSVSPGTVSRIS
jgi:hypothetical protein